MRRVRRSGRRWPATIPLDVGELGVSATAPADAASKRVTVSWQRMEKQRRDLEYAVRTADQDAHTMPQRADLYQSISVDADRVRKVFFEQWYHLGKHMLLDVSTAENEHYGNGVAEVTNRFDAYSAVFREHHAAGSLAQWLSEGSGQLTCVIRQLQVSKPKAVAQKMRHGFCVVHRGALLRLRGSWTKSV